MSDENYEDKNNVDTVVAEYSAEEDTVKDYGLIGSFFQKNFEFIKKIARSNEPILITGDTGTGKDVLAKAIHLLSNRSDNKFNVVNLFATTDSLIESELFGHEKGAFTGAVKKRPGIVRVSEGGTLFLDEIGDIPLGFQIKILRLVENKEIQPVGSDKTENIDIRIIVATNQNLEEMVKQRKFREDLFYRLNIFNFHIPPLKERRNDIYDFILHFMSEYLDNNANASKPSGSELKYAFEKFSSLPLRGNVRELRAYVVRWLAFQGIKTIDQILEDANGFQQLNPSKKKKIVEADIKKSLKINPPEQSEHSKNSDFMELKAGNLNEVVKELEKKMIRLAIEKTRTKSERMNIKGAARLLGIGHKVIYDRFKDYKKEKGEE